MPAERFFYSSSFQSSRIILKGEELHHLAHVMRLRIGDSVELVNGRGELATATLSSLGKTAAEFKIASVFQEKKKYPCIILAQALARQNHLEWIIEKGTELGAASFWLFPGDESEKKEFKQERLEKIATSSMKQCGRLFLPSIEKKPPLSAWDSPSGSLYFGDFTTSQVLSKPKKEPILFFIGPEKGFSSQELSILEHQFKAQGVKLAPYILRCETAAITALSQLQLVLNS